MKDCYQNSKYIPRARSGKCPEMETSGRKIMSERSHMQKCLKKKVVSLDSQI